jgi:hypothetical protein
MRRYGGDPGVLGRPVMLNGAPTEAIGVRPASYAFPGSHVDVWIPDLSNDFAFTCWSVVIRSASVESRDDRPDSIRPVVLACSSTARCRKGYRESPT